MVSKKQWLFIVLAALYGFFNASGSLAGHLGGAFALTLLAVGLTLGYNGVDLTERLKSKLSRD